MLLLHCCNSKFFTIPPRTTCSLSEKFPYFQVPKTRPATYFLFLQLFLLSKFFLGHWQWGKLLFVLSRLQLLSTSREEEKNKSSSPRQGQSIFDQTATNNEPVTLPLGYNGEIGRSERVKFERHIGFWCLTRVHSPCGVLIESRLTDFDCVCRCFVSLPGTKEENYNTITTDKKCNRSGWSSK